jgi:hypothetical protein
MAKPHTGKFIKCVACESKFYVAINRLKTAKYCSRKCKDKFCTIQIIANCLICSKQFTHISSRCNKAKYCSRKCYNKSQVKRGTANFECFHCHKEFKDSPSRVGKRKYCSIECTGKSSKSVWKAAFITVRKNMLRRDLIKKCNRCGFSKFKQILGIHHIDRNRNNNDLSNLEVLCPNCHSIEHMKHTPHGFKE